MLVDVVELRCRGVRRPREELLEAKPIRGELMLSRHREWFYRDPRKAPLLAMLVSTDAKRRMVREPLDEARVVKISGEAMLIVGMQDIERPIRMVDRFRQAWWVRPAVESVQAADDLTRHTSMR